ncbi:MAG: deoxyguanosinetriphosphate triphosphohydrolase, partial [Rhodoferax sp.]|nr:deoxyguanosinetriphosphate triphosphohydrolase [Rhodoferax sp.]
DLGHTPFGHAGQDALNTCMADFGGFEHNLQSLRVVDQLEERYPDFDGLNLCFETREGILKHCSRANAAAIEQREPAYADGQGGVGARFLQRLRPSLEAQLCNLADEIAYNAHDMDDGVRSGLITFAQAQSVPLFGEFAAQALAAHPALGEAHKARRWLYETIRLMLSQQVYDLIATTKAALAAHQPGSVDAVRHCPDLVVFSPSMRAGSQALKAFLMAALYRHPQVMDTMDRAKQVVRDLFAAYLNDPKAMQTGSALRPVGEGAPDVPRAVADYIAGMTDRFAAREHERLTGKRLLA